MASSKLGGKNPQSQEKEAPADILVGATFNAFAALEPREMESWIAGRDPKAVDSDRVKLAKWERPQEGYPCQIVYDRADVRCHDRTAPAGQSKKCW
jgi:hypothetical protein